MYAIGKADKFYTLWSVVEGQEIFNGEVLKKKDYYYMRNLSMDLQTAKDKFEKYTGMTAPEADEELRGTYYSWREDVKEVKYADDEMPWGKWSGVKYTNIPVDYLLWVYNKSGADRKVMDNIKPVLEANGYVNFKDEYSDEYITPEELKKIEYNLKMAEFEATLKDGHWFNEKDKVELTLTVKSQYSYRNSYGNYIYVTKLYDAEKRMFEVSSASNPIEDEEGSVVTVKGTVSHKIGWQDERKFTRLLRVKLV